MLTLTQEQIKRSRDMAMDLENAMYPSNESGDPSSTHEIRVLIDHQCDLAVLLEDALDNFGD